MLPWPNKAHTCGRVDTIRRCHVRVAAKQDTLRLANIDAGAAGAAIEADALQSSREVGDGVKVEGRVIRMLLGWWGS